MNFVVALFIGLVAAAMIHDVRRFIIPNGISIAIVVIFPVHAFLSLDGGQVAWQLLTAGIVFIVTFAMWHRGWIGGGDVKFLSACLLWIRGEDLATFMFFFATASLVVSIVYLAAPHFTRKESAKAPKLKYCPLALPIGTAVIACTF